MHLEKDEELDEERTIQRNTLLPDCKTSCKRRCSKAITLVFTLVLFWRYTLWKYSLWRWLLSNGRAVTSYRRERELINELRWRARCAYIFIILFHKTHDANVHLSSHWELLSIEFDNLHVDFGREFFSGVFTKDSLDLKKFALAKRYACLFSADRVC